MTETLVRTGAPVVTLGTLSPVTVQRSLKAALVSFVSINQELHDGIMSKLIFAVVRFLSA